MTAHPCSPSARKQFTWFSLKGRSSLISCTPSFSSNNLIRYIIWIYFSPGAASRKGMPIIRQSHDSYPLECRQIKSRLTAPLIILMRIAIHQQTHVKHQIERVHMQLKDNRRNEPLLTFLRLVDHYLSAKQRTPWTN